MRTYDILNAGPKQRFTANGRVVSNSGRGLQVQNLAKTDLPALDYAREITKDAQLDTLRLCYGNVSDTLGMLVRTALVPSPGNVFIDCDFSAIEARVIAWLANEQWVLDVFNSHGKIYEATYAQMYGIPVEEVTKKQRQQGKVANLALGFQGGVNALTRMDFGNALTEAEKPVLVKKWREANSKIVKLWYNLQDAAIKAVLTGQPQKVGYITYRHEVSGSQSFLTGELPSGRKLFYVRPRVVEGKWGKPALRFWGKDDKGNWSEQDTYGGHLAENCIARGTLVYTNSGLKPIEQIVKTDLIWDGEKFVVHGGLTTKPKQSIILVDGVGMTPEHKILSQEGWVNASQSKEYSRRAVRVPNSYILRGFGRKEVTLEDTMRLRERVPNASIGVYEEASEVLRLQENGVYSRAANNAWKNQSPDVLGMAFHESSLHEPKRPSVAQLWRSWHISLRKMVGQLRGFLGRYVPNLCAGTGAQSHRQRWELHARELQLGNVQTQCEEQTLKQGHRDTVGQDYCCGSIGEIWHKRNDSAVSAGTRNPGKFVIHYPGFSEQVYDIVDCGNLHRFVVQSNCGPMIVHNCTQAVARDILAENITGLAQAGYAVAFSVHDEVVIDCPRERASLEHTYEEKGVIKLKQSHPVAQIMGTPIPWAPGLPLKAEGWLGSYYTKD